MAKNSTIWRDTFVAALKPTDQVRDIYEDKGFGMRVRPSGTLTWIFKYHFKGKQQILSLGTYRKGKQSVVLVTLAEARSRRGTAQQLLAQGIDPKVQEHLLWESSKPPAPNSEQIKYTVDQLIDDYLEDWSKPRKVANSVKEDTRLLKKYLSKPWGDREVSSIKRTDAVQLIKDLAEVSRGEARNVACIGLGIWNFAIFVKETAESNPFAKMHKKVPKARVPKRKRFLSDPEIKTAWTALTKSRNSPQMCRACKLILLLSQRPGEIIGMRYEDISGDWWTIPMEETKNGRNPNIREENKFDHRVYLPPLAREIIGTGTGYVFTYRGNPIASEQAISHFIAKEITKKDGTVIKEKYFGLPNWRPHDLRRTSATGMANLGAPRDHIDAIQGHIIPGVAGVYIQTRYDGQKMTWLTTWDDHMAKLVGSGPVIQVASDDRERILNDDELRIVWQGLSATSKLAAATANALKLILLTGQAPGECAALHSDDLGRSNGVWWTIGRNKIYLAELAQEIIGNSPSGYIFGPKEGPVKIGTLSHLVLKKEHFGIPKWTPDDLRKSMIAKLTELGAPAGVIHSISSKAPGNEWELKHYLELWDRHLARLIT